jgi:transcriptional regulator with XRE-family HTH domain
MTAYRLDVPELYRRLDVQRAARGLSWRAVGREVGLSPMLFSRLSQGHDPDAHALVSLLVWLDLDTDIAYLVKPREASWAGR